MDQSGDKDQGEKKVYEVPTFQVPFPLKKNQENITINTNTPSTTSKEQIINQAIKLHLEGNIQKAAKFYQYFINQGFKDHKVFSNYGLILQGLGNLQEAEIFTRKAIQLNPNLAEGHLNLGIILKDLGKSEEAELSYRKAIALKPDLAEAHSNLGNILRDLGKLQDAELSTRKAIEINPDFANAHLNLGNILSDLGRSKEAELSIRKAIELKLDYADAHSNLGNILKNLGRPQEALNAYVKSIELNPNIAEVRYNLGNILRDLGKSEEAISHWQKAIKLNPDFAMAHYNLSIFYSQKNDFDKAYKEIKLATKNAPENHIFQGELTRIKFLQGQYDEGESVSNKRCSDKDDYFYEDNNKDVLLVSFGSMGRRNKLIPSFNFYNLLKKNNSFDKLFFRDIDRSYYLTGLHNSTSDLHATIGLIKKLTSQKKYRKIVSIGASAGGFAAILFGHLLEFSKVIAFNPQTVISEEKETLVKDNFYTVGLSKKLRSLNLSDIFYQKCLNLKNFIPFKTKAEIHYSHLSEIDKNHAKFIEHKNCKLIKHNSASHLLALQLRDSEDLKDIIEQSIKS